MKELARIDVEGMIVVIRGMNVIADEDGAALYVVETKERNNLDNFPRIMNSAF